MKKIILIAFSSLLAVSVASSQTGRIRGRVPVGGMGQHIVARNYTGIDCAAAQRGQVQLTGKATAALYFPYIAGIPDEFLFASNVKKDETTAVFTAVFSIVDASQTKNGPMTSTFLNDHDIYYYYHPATTAKGWEDLDAFKAGQHIATYHVQRNMFTQHGETSLVINSGPFTYSADFKLPNGRIANLRDFMPGGILVHVFGSFSPIMDGNRPIVNPPSVHFNQCSVMAPFGGSGTHPAPSFSFFPFDAQ